jgi:uncharacterized membrane protein HdeD (DUF308 family)
MIRVVISATETLYFFLAMSLFFTGVNVMAAFFRLPLCKETYLLQIIGIIGLLISSVVVLVMRMQ